MGSLEEDVQNILQLRPTKIYHLEKGLGAERIVQEEQGHYERFETRHLDYTEPEADHWIVDVPEIKEPNLAARALAKERLENVNLLLEKDYKKAYDSSKWYTVRYLAGVELNLGSDVLGSKVYSWAVELKERLQSGNLDQDKLDVIDDAVHLSVHTGRYPDVDVNVAHLSVNAVLEDCYRNHQDRATRKAVGLALKKTFMEDKKNELRYWKEHHEDAADVLSKLIGAGLIATLGYVAYQVIQAIKE